jgi:hypothetical protein
MKNFSPSTVSPRSGSCSTRTTISVLELPTITILGRILAPVLTEMTAVTDALAFGGYLYFTCAGHGMKISLSGYN